MMKEMGEQSCCFVRHGSDSTFPSHGAVSELNLRKVAYL